MVKWIANICAAVAVLPLIFLAEWIPGLLPYSPNLAHSSDSTVSSVMFPIISGALGIFGIASWLLLRRLHRFGLWTFAVFWLSLVVILLRSASSHQPLDYREFSSLAIFLAFPVALTYVLLKNWKIALRSGTSMERARDK
jgi:hypothetical protein